MCPIDFTKPRIQCLNCGLVVYKNGDVNKEVGTFLSGSCEHHPLDQQGSCVIPEDFDVNGHYIMLSHMATLNLLNIIDKDSNSLGYSCLEYSDPDHTIYSIEIMMCKFIICQRLRKV